MAELTKERLDTLNQVAIGEGCYGRVTMAFWDSSPIVIKTCKRLRARKSFLNEVKMLRLLNGDGGAPKLLACFDSPLRIVTTLVGLETLLEFIVRKPSDTMILRVALAMVEKMMEIHACGILHNDVKNDNIMVSVPRDDAGSPEVSFIDFGLACRFGKSKNFVVSDSYEHIAPEVRRGGASTTASDVYSMGVIFTELALITTDEQAKNVLAAVYTKALRMNRYERISVPSMVRILRQHVCRLEGQRNPTDHREDKVKETARVQTQMAKEAKGVAFQRQFMPAGLEGQYMPADLEGQYMPTVFQNQCIPAGCQVQCMPTGPPGQCMPAGPPGQGMPPGYQVQYMPAGPPGQCMPAGYQVQYMPGRLQSQWMPAAFQAQCIPGGY